MESFDVISDMVRPPTQVDGLGLPIGMVEDVFTRRVLLERETTIHQVSVALGITMPVARQIAESLRAKKIVEFYGMEGRDYRIGLNDSAARRASDRMRDTGYAGYLPVPLQDYYAIVDHQRPKLTVNREIVRQAFDDLVVSDELLDQLGPALLNDGAIFLYGPAGTGKTSLAERMIRLHGDAVLIPRALEVDGSIITIFDPATHDAIDPQPPNLDPRWALCRRPLVVVGGELSGRMLELEYDTISGTYKSPIQLLANNGILVIDDFGRQQISPSEVLNRWIVPLASGIDYLRLRNGSKFTVPFEVKLVTSTNLDPHALGDEAFLRRLRNKVYVGSITDVSFNWVLVRAAKAKGIAVNAEAASHLRRLTQHYLGELRPYVAVDILDLSIGVADYEGLPRCLDIQMIDRVAQIYFVNDGRPTPGHGGLGRIAAAGAAADLGHTPVGSTALGANTNGAPAPTVPVVPVAPSMIPTTPSVLHASG